jgi:Protein of unknown function (DUF3619)
MSTHHDSVNSNRDERAMQLQARLAAQFATALSEGVRDLPHDVTERLRFGREQALAKAREVRLAPQAAPARLAWLNSATTLVLGGPLAGWHRVLSLFPLLMLVAGMFVIEHWATREQVLAAADVDAVLLADDLPPAAYQDPGFIEFLRAPPPP